MLKLERVSKYYFSGNNVVQALRRINLEFKIGEFVGITGVSGSGKSTLLNVLSGLDTYEEGKVYFDGEDISHYTIEELEHYRKDYIGYVFQEYNILSSYTVYQNIELALTIQGYDREMKHRRVMELIDKVGLSYVAFQKANKLSGGEKQRVVIARTLAKDYQILVCDEPTGNLDKESSKGIFQLLRDISKDKLVIVVSHDVKMLQQYATRKIHLYDGEIMEDSYLSENSVSAEPLITPHISKTSFWGSFSIALRNILTVPKKSLFALFTITFIVAMVFFAYSAGILEINQPYESSNNDFTNSDSSRIILIKDDASQFSETEITEIASLKYVRGVFNNDLVLDSIFVTKVYIPEGDYYEFYEYKPLPSLSLVNRDLLEGSFPENENEVVVGNNGIFEIGDTISIANSHLLFYTVALNTDEFEFEVVGLVQEPETLEDNLHYLYLSNAGLNKISASSVYENSEIEIMIDGTEMYDRNTFQWITPEDDPDVDTASRSYLLSYPTWIKIDNSLEDGELLTFNMMFFDICRDFGYLKEVPDDMEAGLCNASQFIESHTFAYRAITTFENNKIFEPITITSVWNTSSDETMKLYMNETTFNYYFQQSNYQITVIVRDSYDGNRVVDELNELGYNVFYPAQILSTSQARQMVIDNIVVTVVIGVIIFGVLLAGYFILRNIIFSKLKDYLIIRSIGTSKRAVKWILSSEIYMITLIAMILIATFVFLSEVFFYWTPEIIRFFHWYDFILLIGLILLVMQFMAHRFTKLIFSASVVTALKGVER